MAKDQQQPEQRITRDDLEQKLRAITQPVEEATETIQTVSIAGVGILSFLLIMFIFLMGRRAGKKRRTIIEVRSV
ncbi:MAG: hypothetical protein KAZ88_05485 [Acidimicrobiia bacterium]|nr:hypothetical protein [Acidimicrobiia bacterium]MBP8180425.1 hypothetical protein [Acidimicrobiia bacterium]